MRALLLCLFVFALTAAAQAVNYDIVYVRAPRLGDNTYVRFPDVFFPTAMPAGSDMMLLHPNGTEETLFPAGNGAMLDPAVSFDAQRVFFSYIPDATANGINPQRGLAYGGADIYEINLQTRQVVRLTQQTWTPPAGSANWSSDPLSAKPAGSIYLGFGFFNLGACPLPGGKMMFVSSRDGYAIYLPDAGQKRHGVKHGADLAHGAARRDTQQLRRLPRAQQVDFNTTAAALASYQPSDLTTQTPLLSKDAGGNTIVKQAGKLLVDVEYFKDIKPILQRSCIACHSKNGTAAAGLVLDDNTIVNGYENTYNRLG